MTGTVVLITGLPSSGKTTLAAQLRERLQLLERPCCILDGDAVRACLVPKPGYSGEERGRFYQSLANLAGMIARQGLIVLVPATAHKRSYRTHARAVAPRLLEVFVDTPPDECRRRDTKGLYAAPRDVGDNLPGSGLDYEPPLRPDVIAAGGATTAAVDQTLAALFAPHS